MRHAHSFKKITPEHLQARLREGDRFLLLDTLPAERFAKVHLPGAVNACIYEITFTEQVHGLCSESSTPIVAYGASSNSLDSRTAAEKLTMAGYSDVSILEGGLERWKQAGYPLEGSAPESVDRDDDLLIEDGSYAILAKDSSITWTGRNSNTRHYGTLGISGGRLQLEGGTVLGSISVDMESIENLSLAGNELQPVLVSHLKSEDFFLTDAFPAALFTIRRGRFNPDPHPTRPNGELTGTLELLGVQNDLHFEATIVKWLDGRLHLTAHFDLDRTLWGITYGSSRYYEHLGMHSVYDLVSIELRIVAEKQ